VIINYKLGKIGVEADLGCFKSLHMHRMTKGTRFRCFHDGEDSRRGLVVTSCSDMVGYQRFGGPCDILPQH
jgi:hypothetical protein